MGSLQQLNQYSSQMPAVQEPILLALCLYQTDDDAIRVAGTAFVSAEDCNDQDGSPWLGRVDCKGGLRARQVNKKDPDVDRVSGGCEELGFSVRRANCPRYSSACVPFTVVVHNELAQCQSDGYFVQVRRKHSRGGNKATLPQEFSKPLPLAGVSFCRLNSCE